MGFYRKRENINRKIWKMRTATFAALALILAIVFSTAIFGIARADGGIAETTSAKARQNGLKKCVNSIIFQSGPFTTSGNDIGGESTTKYKKLDTVLTSEAKEDRVLVPNKYGNTDSDGTISCKQVFAGGSGISGSYPVPTASDGLDKIDGFLTSVGYKGESVTAEGDEWSCYTFSFKVNHANGGNTTITEYAQPLCVRTNGGKVAAQGKKFSAPVDAFRASDGEWTKNQAGNVVKVDAYTGVFGGTDITVWFTATRVSNPVSVSQGSVSIKVGDDWSTIVSKLDAIAGRVKTFLGDMITLPDNYLVQEDEVAYNATTTWSFPAEGSTTDKKYTYYGGDAKKALKFLTGLDDFVPYIEAERNWMYYTYFSDSKYFNALSVDGDCTTTKPTGKYLQYYDSGKDETTYCPISDSSMANARTKPSLNAIVSVGGYDLAAMGVDNILAGLNGIDLKSYCGQDPDFPLCKATPKDCATDPTLPGCSGGGGGGGGGGGTTEPSEPSDEEKCYAESKSLGWVICPIIFGLREMTEHFYEGVEPLIMTNDSIVSQLGDNSSGLYGAWAIFRGFANILFVIFFMFIIFSQLTGFGIDNYGIKRMLPKLIITAVLVNLSFWICAAAVDISNIAGKSIKTLLESVGNGIFSDFGGSSATAVGYMGSRLVGVIAGTVTVGIIGAVAFALEGWALIIPILLFFLTTAIAIFFALIVLGMRQALVVILIVVAPIALACMVLPNTESIYKKWFSAAKGILMVYPIAGAIIGAGYLTGSILMSADDGFIMTIVSGILMVGPYFLIPSLTRKALDAVGNVGSRIGNFGSRIGGGARNRINNAEGVKNFRANQAANARYNRLNKGISGKIHKGLDDWTMKSAEKNKGKRGAGAWIANHTIASNGRLRAVQRNEAARVDNARETVMQGAQAASARRQRMENGGFAARDANLENQALEGAIADQTSLWEKDGTFGSDEKFRSEVAAAALGDDDESRAKLEALMRKAANGSDKQRELLRKGMDDAFKTGNVSASQAARYGAHVTGNAIYKKNNRSMHDQANAIMNAVGNGTYGTQGTAKDANGNEYSFDHRVQSLSNDNFVGQGFNKGKQSEEAAFSYDDGEFNALADKMTAINKELASTTISDERRAELNQTKENIAKTLGEGIFVKENDPNNKYGNVDAHTISEMKRVIDAGYGDNGWKQFYKSDSGAFKVNHDQPQIVTENVESAFNEGWRNGTINHPDPGNNNGNGPIIIT